MSFALHSFSDDTIFRRIPVLVNCAGSIYLSWFNIDELKRHAILIFSGEDPSSTNEVDADPYKITFFYVDDDGDKTMIAFDSDLEQAVRQFREEGGLKIFANVQSVRDLPQAPPTQSTASVTNLATKAACSSVAAFLSPRNVPNELQDIVAAAAAAAATAAVIAVWEHIQPSTNATKAHAQASDSIPLRESANTRNRFRTAPINSARFNATNEQESEDNTTASMPGLAPVKDYTTTFRQAAMTVEAAYEEEQTSSSDEEESDDSMPRLVARESRFFHQTSSAVKPSVPREVTIASDIEERGDIDAVLGKKVAQAIDNMQMEIDHTAWVEEIEEESVIEDGKGKKGVYEDGSSNISEPGEDDMDDCSHDSWNVVSDHSDDAEPRD